MSINAINSVSLYEYYYSINKKGEKDKSLNFEDPKPVDKSPQEIAMQKRFEQIRNDGDETKEQKEDRTSRPWADLMYQLGLQFNDNPKDDIQDIKDELSKLISGMQDDELLREVNDLESSIESMYVRFEKNSLSYDFSNAIGSQLDNMSMVNLASFYK